MKRLLRKGFGLPMGGFSLVEVLVALLVLSVGLLGLAGLQAKSLKANHQAYLRSQAALDATQIIDCMRANHTNLSSYAIAIGAQAPSGTSVADEDLAAWKNTLQGTQGPQGTQGLPGPGDGSVAVSGQQVTVTVQWQENGRLQKIEVQTTL